MKNIDLSYKNLIKLPRNLPNKINCSFYCDHNQLTSLERAPQIVGSFYCYNNQLTTLEGAPQEVGGDFYCRNNPNLSLQEILKYLVKAKIKGNIGSDYDDKLLNRFNKAKTKYEKIMLVFKEKI